MRQRMVETVDFWRFLLRRFFADRAMQAAAGLTYTTLFAVVPMMTVTFVILSAVPAFQGMGEDIQGFIFRNFVASSGATVQGYLHDFITQARRLTWVGVVLLAMTAFMMLLTIEKAFNTIWRVREPRRGVSSFLLYWAILSLGPLLLGAGFAASTYITSLSLLSGPNAVIEARTVLRFAPLLTSMAAFTLIYATVPNTRVPLRDALLGGVFTAVLFEVAKWLFRLFVSFFPGYQLIYGAFATVPLFLLWVYVSWLIVLFGAELVCNLSSSYEWRRKNLPRVLVLFGLLRLFHDGQQRGKALRHGDVQREGWLLQEHEWEEILEFLEDEHLVCRVSGGDGWALCRDLEHFSLHALLVRCPWPIPRPDQLPDDLDEAWYPAFREALKVLDRQKAELFGESLATWLRGEQRPAE
ncbi:YihY family inner membrane protein [Pseudomonas sp. LRF_L74]|uniref:YihY family inner membrane protein n=1 Tax=Pseudomonas sp. LRF_L74 TaxID=3369422 RepID=UPI003F5F79DA